MSPIEDDPVRPRGTKLREAKLKVIAGPILGGLHHAASRTRFLRRSSLQQRRLAQARRVTLLCGSGSEGAHAQLMQLAEAVKAPIVHAMRGKEHVSLVCICE